MNIAVVIGGSPTSKPTGFELCPETLRGPLSLWMYVSLGQMPDVKACSQNKYDGDSVFLVLFLQYLHGFQSLFQSRYISGTNTRVAQDSRSACWPF